MHAALRRGIMRLASLSLLLVAVTACGPTAIDDGDSDSLDAPVGKADAASVPGGAYTNATPHFGEISTISLNQDHSFTLAQLVACPGGGTCAPAVETGRFLLTHSTTNSNRYVRLYATDDSDLGRYQWKLTSTGKLQLKSTEDSGAAWFTMAKGATCESAGGTCDALTPDSCSGGAIGDATEYSCGGGLGVECCLPAETSSCTKDSQCGGFVPQFCQACSDGTQACAHWTCAENTCAVVACPNP
jgi:hypothetical protein